jgi:hypothetical protein
MSNQSTLSGAGEVVISNVHHKGAVARTQSDEYVEITNRGADPVKLAGWVLDAGDAGQRFTFPPGTVLAPGRSIRVYTNEVHAETGGFTFGSKRSIWSDAGDVARLRDPFGKVVSQLGYGNQRLVEQSPAPAPEAGTTQSSTKAPEAGASSGESLSAAEIWARVKAFWPGFEFMWQPGHSEEEIAAAEQRLGLTLPARVRDLMRECSGPAGGFPEREYHTWSADVCLWPVTQWKHLDQWEDARAREYVVIGSNDYMMDKGAYVLLHPGTGEVIAFELHNNRLMPKGSFERWLEAHEISTDNYRASAEVDELEVEAGQTLAQAIARRHRNWLSQPRTPAWEAVQSKFIEAVNRLRGD